VVKLFVMLVKLHFDASTPSIHYTRACNYIKTKQRDMHVGQPFNNCWVHSENQLLELSLFIQTNALESQWKRSSCVVFKICPLENKCVLYLCTQEEAWIMEKKGSCTYVDKEH
jgi:hypothetical protein